MRQTATKPRWTAWAMAGLLLLHGCGAAIGGLAIESKPVMRLHAPMKVEVGHAFPIAVDVDSACGEFRRLTIEENGFTKTITVDVMFQPPPPNTGCIAAIVPRRFEGTTVATTVGTYSVDFKGYDGRVTRTLEVVGEPVPPWLPPAFDPSDASFNY